MNVGEKIQVRIKKISLGRDNKVYVTLEHLDAENNPTFVFTKEKYDSLVKSIK